MNEQDQRLVDKFKVTQVVLAEMFAAKQQCYGPGNIAAFGTMGVLIRANDKIQRLIRLVWNKEGNTVPTETVRDSWMDLAVYATIALLLMDGDWPGVKREEEYE